MLSKKRFTVLLLVAIAVYSLYLVSCTKKAANTPTATEPPIEQAYTPAYPNPTLLPTTSEPIVTPAQEPFLPMEQPPVGTQVALNPALGGLLSSFRTEDFSGPAVCANCHVGLIDRAGEDVSMPSSWRSTMMANAAIDPVWQAKVSSEVARQPELREVIEKKCATCHMPMAVTQSMTRGEATVALEDGYFKADDSLHAAAIDGVSCTLCHQVTDTNLGTIESFSGHYVIDTNTSAPNRLIFGPYTQPVTQQMRNQSGYTPTYGEHMLSAEHCGTCHNLYTPYVDGQGNILGEFPEQTPYTEWQYSQYGAENSSCQSCHMPLAEGSVVISQMPRRLSARSPFFKHYFVGGNDFMPQILADWGNELEVSATPSELTKTISRAQEQISTNTAQLELLDLNREGSILTIQLQVDVLTGHKFPASFPSRRSWLHLTITDANGQIVFESGKPNPDGSISGNAADFDATTYEPHYDLITQPEQVQIYEGIMQNSDGEVTYTLLRAAAYAKDNRLLPLGAVKEQLPADIAVYGEAVTDMNFVGGSDQITYQVDLGTTQGPFSVQVELLYETLSYRFVQDLVLAETDLTNRFGNYYFSSDKTPLKVAVLPPVTTE